MEIWEHKNACEQTIITRDLYLRIRVMVPLVYHYPRYWDRGGHLQAPVDEIHEIKNNI
jgi:hypothetical protein